MFHLDLDFCVRLLIQSQGYYPESVKMGVKCDFARWICDVIYI